ncbi:NUDIX domain-containing protein [Microbacterium sp. HD4P20]|uniref:NUDIX hydrolase n=1 Tax=Microbacterium sp. HD4P20 TaxID=2864874 RepID=UPI001C6400EF|nr:NUDIX domain-containing protein [Microbacterium sp. HD4P20]MCP2635532.1 NUDIX domain-containing protein [Microbacterium sp. HD4P20]
MARVRTDKVVCYVVDRQRLLVFTHLDRPSTVTGVQVPAGTVKAGENAADAAVRETLEETGLRTRVVRELGSSEYDMAPYRDEIARRSFFQLELDEEAPERWIAGERDPATGGGAERWECWWLALADAHVLSAGLGALLGRIES